MKIKPLVAALVAALTLAAAPAPAAAQWAVFDAANFIKNTMTATQTYQQYAQMLNDYAMQAQQYVTMVRNLEQMPASVLNTAVGREIVAQAGGNPSNPDSWNGISSTDLLQAGGQVMNVYKSSAQLMSQGGRLYQQATDFGVDMNRFSAASGMSWQEIFAYEQKRSQADRQAAQWRFQQAQQMTSQLQSFQQRADQQVKVAGEAQGAVQAISAVATLNHTMTDQLSSLIAASARQEVREAQKQDTGRQAQERRLQQEDEARRREKSFTNFLRGGQK